jgi:hypothetical protein
VNIGYFQDCQAILLMTDGISDPRFETDAGLNNLQKWQQLWQEIQPNYSMKNRIKPYWNGQNSLVQDIMMIVLWQFMARFIAKS